MTRNVETESVTTSDVVQRVEEVATIVPVSRLSGRVDVSTTTETFEEILNEVLTSSNAEVSRHKCDLPMPVGEPLPGTRVENGITIVPVFEERIVIEKRLYLVEEIRIRVTEKTENVAIPVLLRRQRVDVSRSDFDPEDAL